MSKAKYIATFAVGALVGSAASWLYLRKKYEQLVQEEIKSVKEAFKEQRKVEEILKDSELTVAVVEEEIEDEEDSEEEYEDDFDEYKDEYDDIIEHEQYGPVHQSYANKPYVITPDEFGDMGSYDTAGLSYYADKVLADEKGYAVDINETIGDKNLQFFGEYEEDMLYVRNPNTNIDYEVFLDPRKYSEVYPGRV